MAEKKRMRARKRREGTQGVMSPNFAVGDYVLVGRVVSRANKLALQWRGPQRIVRVIHDYIYEV